MKSIRATVVLLVVAAVSVGCAGVSSADSANLAEQPPLPYSVLVTGAGVVEAPPEVAESRSGYARTFAPLDDQVVVPVADLARALRDTRVFARVEIDAVGDERLGWRLRDVREGLPLDDPEVAALLERARQRGHDYVLLLQRLLDGPIEDWGINDRWPLTAATWLLVGLGILVQDHTFESRASLEATLFDVEEGRIVHRSIGSGAVAELALLGRGNVWSVVQSVIVPPFWVGSHEEKVLASVRAITVPRLVSSLARELKGAVSRRDIAERARVEIEIELREGAALVRTRCDEGIGSVAARVDGVALVGPEVEGFVRSLLGGERELDGQTLVAEAELPLPPAGRFLQLLVRTVSGGVASTTVELRGR